MGKTSDKGKYFERAVAKEIATQFGFKYNQNIIRTPNSGGLKYAKGDIQVLNAYFPFHVECKFGYDFDLNDLIKENAKINNFIKQADEDNIDKIPIVIVSKPYYNRYVVVKKEYLNHDNMKILSKLNKPFLFTNNYFCFLLEDLALFYNENIFKGGTKNDGK